MTKDKIEVPGWVNGIYSRIKRARRKAGGDLKDYFQIALLVLIVKFNGVWGKWLFGDTFVPLSADYLTMFVFAFLGVACAHVASKWFNRRHWPRIDDDLEENFNKTYDLSRAEQKISVMSRQYWLYCFLYAILCLAYGVM